MNPTKIEYCHATWNPITGCRHTCRYCYMKRMHKRWGKSTEPEFHERRLHEYDQIEPSIIFAVDMGDIFSPGVKSIWRDRLFHRIESNPQHDYLLLTKNPRYAECLPGNCWAGVSVTCNADMSRVGALPDKNYSYIQFEPLLESIDKSSLVYAIGLVDWVIIGRATQHKHAWDPSWALAIVNMCVKMEKPVFVKSNAKLDVSVRGFPNELGEKACDLHIGAKRRRIASGGNPDERR